MTSRFAASSDVSAGYLSRNARWALRQMEASTKTAGTTSGGIGLSNVNLGGGFDTENTTAMQSAYAAQFDVHVPEGMRRRLAVRMRRSSAAVTDAPQSASLPSSSGNDAMRRLYEETEGFGTHKRRRNHNQYQQEEQEEGGNMRRNVAAAAANANASGGGGSSSTTAYDDRDFGSGKSIIQSRFDDWVVAAIVNYCPVTVQSVRANELYTMLRRVVPDFTVDTHCDGMPLTVLCSQCSYLNSHGGRLHFMRVIRPTGRHGGPKAKSASAHSAADAAMGQRRAEEAMFTAEDDEEDRISHRMRGARPSAAPMNARANGEGGEGDGMFSVRDNSQSQGRGGEEEGTAVGSTEDPSFADASRHLDPDSVKRSMLKRRMGGDGSELLSKKKKANDDGEGEEEDYAMAQRRRTMAASLGDRSNKASSTTTSGISRNLLDDDVGMTKEQLEASYAAFDAEEERLMVGALKGNMAAADALRVHLARKREAAAAKAALEGRNIANAAEEKNGDAEEDLDDAAGGDDDDLVFDEDGNLVENTNKKSEGVLAAEAIKQAQEEGLARNLNIFDMNDEGAFENMQPSFRSTNSNGKKSTASHHQHDGGVLSSSSSPSSYPYLYPTNSPDATDTMTHSLSDGASQRSITQELYKNRKAPSWRAPLTSTRGEAMQAMAAEEAAMSNFYGEFAAAAATDAPAKSGVSSSSAAGGDRTIGGDTMTAIPTTSPLAKIRSAHAASSAKQQQEQEQDEDDEDSSPDGYFDGVPLNDLIDFNDPNYSPYKPLAEAEAAQPKPTELKTVLDADGYEVVVEVPMVDEALVAATAAARKAHVEKLSAAKAIALEAIAAQNGGVEGNSEGDEEGVSVWRSSNSQEEDAAEIDESNAAIAENADAAFDCLMMDGDDDAAAANTSTSTGTAAAAAENNIPPPPRPVVPSSTSTLPKRNNSTSPASEESNPHTGETGREEPAAASDDDSAPHNPPRKKKWVDTYWDNSFQRPEERPEPGTVSLTKPNLKPMASDEYAYLQNVVNSKSPYKQTSMEDYERAMAADAAARAEEEEALRRRGRMYGDDDNDSGPQHHHDYHDEFSDENDAYLAMGDDEEVAYASMEGRADHLRGDGAGRTGGAPPASGGKRAASRRSRSFEEDPSSSMDDMYDAGTGADVLGGSGGGGSYGGTFTGQRDRSSANAHHTVDPSAEESAGAAEDPTPAAHSSYGRQRLMDSYSASATNPKVRFSAGTQHQTPHGAPSGDAGGSRKASSSDAAYDERDYDIYADPEAALLDGRAMTVGLSKFEFRQAAPKDGVRTGPQPWRNAFKDTFNRTKGYSDRKKFRNGW